MITIKAERNYYISRDEAHTAFLDKIPEGYRGKVRFDLSGVTTISPTFINELLFHERGRGQFTFAGLSEVKAEMVERERRFFNSTASKEGE